MNRGTSVPVSNLSTLVYETKKDLAKEGILSTIVGHVGDGRVPVSILTSSRLRELVGNFHALLMFRSDEELPVIRDAVHRMVHRAIALDGTCEFRWDSLLLYTSYAIHRHRGAWSWGW